MPLRAIIEGEHKTSIHYSEDAWNNLKELQKKGLITIVLPCCIQKGFLRKSSKGLQHFIHAKGETLCDWKPETHEHLTAKAEIIKACMDSGWDAVAEYSQNDWRADVLACSGEKRIAFEVQWSPQSSEETKIRQDKFLKDDVRGCWLFKTVPKGFRLWKDHYQATKEIPFFKILKNEDCCLVIQNSNRQTTIYDFVAALLNRKFKFCGNYTTKRIQQVDIIFFDTSCWKCGKHQHLYTVGNSLQTKCDTHFETYSSMWDEDNLDKDPGIIKTVKEFLLTEPGKNLKVGDVKYRYSNTVDYSYLSFGCYYCDAIFGDYHLRTEKMYVDRSGSNIVCSREINLSIKQTEGEHWCYSENSEFCE